MCGIYGMVNGHPVAEDLVRGLGRLEYRGYDSAGVALMTEGRIARRRVAGRVTGLDESLEARPLSGCLGIAHTRWATHGGPSEDNAHPHVAGRVAVVHNGIVENHAALRRELQSRGRVFHSETDSEVVAHLLDEALSAGRSPREALRATCERLDGSFALGVLIEGHERLLAARRGSPLVVGAMHGGAVLASDALALADDAEGVLALEDGEVAELGRGGIEVFDAAGLRVDRELAPVAADEIAERGDFDSFMAKEMHEQPTALRRALAHLGCRGIRWDAVDEVVFASCGTSRYASEVGAAWLRELAGLSARVVIASELRYAPGPWSAAAPGRTLAVFVSQSGETADTLAALEEAQRRGIGALAVVNVAGSTMAREADHVIFTRAGKEVGVASTKAFTAQLAALAGLAIEAARALGAAAPELQRALGAVPEAVARVLAEEDVLAAHGARIAEAGRALFVGRGVGHALALEGALKLKEITYLHAEGFAAGELKHGPLALVEEGMPCVALAFDGPLVEKTGSNVREVMARGGEPVLLTDRAALGHDLGACATVVLPGGLFAPVFAAAVALQLIAYHAAQALGRDVDKPRNLAKSVTVE